MAREVLQVLDELFERRRWLLSQLKVFEKKYRMKTREFLEKWRRGKLPEPEDPEVHGDFFYLGRSR